MSNERYLKLARECTTLIIKVLFNTLKMLLQVLLGFYALCRLKNAPYVATLQTYKGGGYVVNFERSFRRTARNLTRLRQENWLDLRTRAIFLEFTVYNPNSNLFASAILVTEFPSWGSAIPRSEIKVIKNKLIVSSIHTLIKCYIKRNGIFIKKQRLEACRKAGAENEKR